MIESKKWKVKEGKKENTVYNKRCKCEDEYHWNEPIIYLSNEKGKNDTIQKMKTMKWIYKGFYGKIQII